MAQTYIAVGRVSMYTRGPEIGLVGLRSRIGSNRQVVPINTATVLPYQMYVVPLIVVSKGLQSRMLR